LPDYYDGINFGHAVASFGNGVTLNWRKPGRALFAKQHPWEKPEIVLGQDTERLKKILRMTAELPDDAYQRVMLELDALSFYDQRCDFNPGNFVIKPSQERLGLIDPLGNNDEDSGPQGHNSLGQLLRILTHSYVKSSPETDNDKTLQFYRLAIITKFFNAAENGLGYFNFGSNRGYLKLCLEKAGMADNYDEWRERAESINNLEKQHHIGFQELKAMLQEPKPDQPATPIRSEQGLALVPA
jgi:hypothetical protein